MSVRPDVDETRTKIDVLNEQAEDFGAASASEQVGRNDLVVHVQPSSGLEEASGLVDLEEFIGTRAPHYARFAVEPGNWVVA